MQSAPVQLTRVPPKPTCNLSAFSGADCQDRWHLYNQAAHQATAPLQQQIEDLNKLATDLRAQIKEQSDQTQADSIVALQAKLDSATAVRQTKTEAYTEGLQQGVGIGVGASLLLFGLIFGIRRMMRTSPVKKSQQARAASA